MSTHTADAAPILEDVRARPAVVVGTSAGAAIATHRIEGAGHAAPFDATRNFVHLIADAAIEHLAGFADEARQA